VRPCFALILFACTTGIACTTDPQSSETSGPIGSPALVCDPSDADACWASPKVTCCSDDPAALDLGDIDALVTPAYLGRGGDGPPVFSGANNMLSRSGMCVEEGSVSTADALTDVNAVGCPVPCNPTWSASEVAEICGAGRVCCQTRALEPEDCVLDPGLGDSGCWRPAHGGDIAGLGGLEATNWGSTSHVTHQDPSGTNCQLFVQGVPPSVLTASGVTVQQLLLACYLRLSVANRRGFCVAPDDACPLSDPSHVDACEQLNLDDGRMGC